jgi:hypothetical protein
MNAVKLKYLLRNITLLNIILAAAVFFFADYMVLPFFNMGIRVALPVASRVTPGEAASAQKPAGAKSPSPADYLIIADQNLFHPERKIPVSTVAAAPLPKPDFVLYGTLVSGDGDLGVAYMEDKKSPRSTPGRGKRQSALRVGDSLSGFTLKEIGKDSVTMQRGQEKMVVMLDDSQNPKTREVSAQATVPALGAAPQREALTARGERQQPSAGVVGAVPQPPAQTPAAQPRTNEGRQQSTPPPVLGGPQNRFLNALQNALQKR